MKIGVTGASGFLGWHLGVRFELEGHDVVRATRETFTDPDMLRHFSTGLDVVVHAAGVNRSEDPKEIATANPGLAEQLGSALDAIGSTARVIYTNSIQSDAGTIYGNAKQAAADVLARRQARAGAGFVDLVLPHLFGEFGRPFYNSVVSTFAHALATGGEATVERDGRLELLHAQQVAVEILALLEGPATGRHRLGGRECSVGEVWDLLASQHARYVDESTIPLLADQHELRVFNTLRSQLYLNGHYPVAVTQHSDERGAFAELVRADGLGQTSVSTSKPGITRGDHYHLDKIERFVVIEGSARICVRRLGTNHVDVYDVTGDHPAIIDMPTLCTHNITNVGAQDLITVFWAGDHFDPGRPDTHASNVNRHQ